jgi:quercetin dioxygenase-like cupin family protein
MEFVSGNVYIREMRFEKAGDQVQGHAHNFDHTTYVAAGALLIEHMDESGNVLRSVEKRAADGRNWVLIKAGAQHRITALVDGSIGHCIYSHRSPQGDVVEHYDGWPPAYF